MTILEFSSLPEDYSGFDIRDPRLVQKLQRAEDEHFWFRSRNRLIESKLRALEGNGDTTILEIGCGSGCVTAHLSRSGYRVTGIDGHRPLLELAQRRAPDATFWLHDMREDPDILPSADFDLVGLFDVIEHLDDPSWMLERALRWTSPGGHLVGTVPASPRLWSRVDAESGHRRRFDAPSLRSLLQQVDGAGVIDIQGFHHLLYPVLWLQRRMLGRGSDSVSSNLEVPRLGLNSILWQLTRLERRCYPRSFPSEFSCTSLWFSVHRR